jgi:two-component system response regulator AtoC
MRKIPGAQNLVVLNPAMKAVYEQVAKVADHDSPVLIIGETGTGKEHVAAALHAAGPRRKKPFVTVNCGGIPADLVESIFFGHEKGAFTSATISRVGVFEKASGGVLFLDEVGDLPWESQASLLRAVETGRITRIGSNRDIQVDVRVVSATNCDLEQMVAEKRFRKDLLYRLNAVTFELAPLRNRRDEIKPLAELFLARFCESYKRPRITIDPSAMELLESNDWPGNIRQLKSAIERSALLAPGSTITAELLPAALDDSRVVANAPPPIRQKDESDLSFQQRLKQWEKRAIKDALRRTEGNRTEAARILRMPRRTFARKLAAYGLTRKKRDSG